ncbi:uncharacterized protein DUF4263 [Microbacterium telephonicum]|uniref:Uncharacterized protein DUF4263 n=2 Tax=Microbacterium telephonicum TaxID=1714841 RepID=A0A498CAJ8_9MICO|nr:uncharacterized protein DUF4263 [Microbacterium telephonicum]
MAEWRALLASSPAEEAVQKWLEFHPSFIPGGSGDVGPGGHHGSEMGAVVREAPLHGLGKQRRPDFMWVTRSSGLITPILIEIEKPDRRWFKRSGRPTKEFSEALDQLADWKVWFSQPENQSGFRETYLGTDKFRDRPLAPQYVLIYGRQSEFERVTSPHKDPARLRQKRDFMRRAAENFRTFDSLRPDPKLRDSITVSQTSDGPTLWALAPTFESGPLLMETAERLLDFESGIVRSKFIAPDRSAYLATRWQHWRNAAAGDRAAQAMSLQSMDRE